MIAAPTTSKLPSHWPALWMTAKPSRITLGSPKHSTPKAISWVLILPSPHSATKRLARGRTRRQKKPRQNAARKPEPYYEWAARILTSLLIPTVSEANAEGTLWPDQCTRLPKQRLQSSI